MDYNILDIIRLKRDGEHLSTEQINWFIENLCLQKIPDYQTSSLLMAIYLQGMDVRETADLALAMAHSGRMVNFDSLNGVRVDKHSTGGVGDKVTLVVVPLLASMGVFMAKLSGRALGHTGGTIDKLESLEGLETEFRMSQFISQIEDIGVALMSPMKNLVPADKKLYALRDVTGTIESLPLIAASIMSKKIASGSDKIILDIKIGDGAFVKELEDAQKLARIMINIGKHVGRETVAVLSRMDEPLGLTIGNSLEVQEAIEILKGKGEEKINQVVYEIALIALELSGIEPNREAGIRLINQHLSSGLAYQKFIQFIRYQGATEQAITKLVDNTIIKTELRAPKSGYISSIKAYNLGRYSMHLGAGRQDLDSQIDLYVGLALNKKTGDYIEKDDSLLTIYHRKNHELHLETLLESYTISEDLVTPPPILYEILR